MALMFVFIALLLVSQGFIVLEEETLIILASFIWVDAAGGVIRNALDTALIKKGDLIQEKFVYFLNIKKKLVSDLILSHKSRVNMVEVITKLYNYSLNTLITNICKNYIHTIKNIRNNQSKTVVFEKGQSLSQIYLYRRLGYCFNLVHKSGSSINSILSTNELNPAFNYGEASLTKLKTFL